MELTMVFIEDQAEDMLVNVSIAKYIEKLSGKDNSGKQVHAIVVYYENSHSIRIDYPTKMIRDAEYLMVKQRLLR